MNDPSVLTILVTFQFLPLTDWHPRPSTLLSREKSLHHYMSCKGDQSTSTQMLEGELCSSTDEGFGMNQRAEKDGERAQDIAKLDPETSDLTWEMMPKRYQNHK